MPAVFRAAVTVMVACAAVLSGVLPAAAQEPYPLRGSITCDASVTAPGTTVACAGDGFELGAEVDVEAEGGTTDGPGAGEGWSFRTTVTADDDGVATATIEVDEDAVGPVSLTFTGTGVDGQERVLRSIGAFTVVAPQAGDGGTDVASPAPPAPSGPLSSTGGPFVLGGAAVLVLLVLGGGLVLLGRRRAVRL